MPTEYAELVLKAETGDLATAEQRLKALHKPAERAERASGRLTKAFRVQKGATQQAAFQVQDFAVQMAGGTSAIRAFTQQGPQLLSILGPGGAILGGLVAVGGALAGVFMSGLLDSKDATEQLTIVLEDLDSVMAKTKKGTVGLSKEMLELSRVSMIAAQAMVTESILSAEDAMEELRGKIVESAQELGVYSLAQAELIRSFRDGEISATQLQEAYDRLFLASSKSSKEFRENRKALGELTEGFAKVEQRVSALKKIEDELRAGRITDAQQIDAQVIQLDKLSDARAKAAMREADRQAKAENQRIANAQKSIFALEDSFRAQDQVIEDRYNIQLAKINAAEKLQLDTEKSYEDLRLANKQQFNEASMRLEANRMSSLSGFMGQSAQILQDGLGKQNAVTKLAFAAQKLLAIPQMIVATETGAAQALALGPIAGPPLAALVKGLGYASIGAVVGTTLAGRSLGGQVRPGEAYRVGEFGPETLVMGSNGGFITPNAGGGGNAQPVQVVNNVKVIGGDGNAEVTTTTRQVSDVKFVQDIVVDMMTRPNSRGRVGMSANSNLVNRGTR
jgi:hypothetical protein